MQDFQDLQQSLEIQGKDVSELDPEALMEILGSSLTPENGTMNPIDMIC